MASSMKTHSCPAAMLLYGSHALSTAGERAFEFLIGLILIKVYNDSLFMVALFGLLDSLVVSLASSHLGILVDSLERLKGACVMYLGQNVGIFVASIGFYILLSRSEHDSVGDYIVVSMSIMAACLSSLGAMGATISVERGWTKALCGEDVAMLSSVNAIMKRIDLVSLIASPILVGILIESQGYLTCLVCLCGFNVGSFVLECYFLQRAMIYEENLRRASPSHERPAETQASSMAAGLTLYLKQDCVWYSASLALVYLTVMSFGTIMTGYLAWRGLGESVLSIFRGIGAALGVGATVFFPYASTRWGLPKSALFAICGQCICIALAVVPIVWVGDQFGKAAEMSLLLFLSLSRFFLWLFDLSVNQIMQLESSKDSVGAIFGIQNAFQSGFQTVAYVMTMVFSNPHHFEVLMLGSTLVVVVASIATFVGYRKHNHEDEEESVELMQHK